MASQSGSSGLPFGYISELGLDVLLFGMSVMFTLAAVVCPFFFRFFLCRRLCFRIFLGTEKMRKYFG